MIRHLAARLAGTLAARVDRAFVRFAFNTRHPSQGRPRNEARYEPLDEAAAFYSGAQGRLFACPPPAELTLQPSGPLRGGDVVDVTWKSAYEPLHPTAAAFFAKVPGNYIAAARWLRHRQEAPAIIFLHGWGTGSYGVWQRYEPVRRLYRSGADILLFTLPFHGRRARFKRGRPPFPSPNPFRSNECLAQAVSDLRGLMQALAQRGSSRIVVSGLSLGAFTTALLATVEPDCAAALLMAPFASLPQILWEQGESDATAQQARSRGLSFERFAAAFAATAPLLRRPLLPPRRVMIVAGERDQVTPLRYALALRDHFSSATERARLVTYPGGHLWQAGRSRALAAVEAFLRQHSALGSAVGSRVVDASSP